MNEFKSPISAGAIATDQHSRLLLIREEDGWGLPAGYYVPKDILPSNTAKRELLEETDIVGKEFKLCALSVSHRSIGFIYKVASWSGTPAPRNEIMDIDFFTSLQVIDLLNSGKIRKLHRNLPGLIYFISKSITATISF